ncbi:hypothetical protein HMPREF0682_1914 [Propionibacterium acidifaciens F0233]|uniref:Uncharacterized protein n=1 Tax=Propionibacterium acidifaciens F0233 TaxID=553198 RepID=U2QMT2_9ACTN|nr:hypothetical protein HMPREF0682_1914 [Propionibacterium acidifaciens F0233]
MPHAEANRNTSSTCPHLLHRLVHHDTTMIEDHNMVRKTIHLFHVVSAQQDGMAILSQSQYPFPDRIASLHIDPQCRFIEYEHRRLMK